MEKWSGVERRAVSQNYREVIDRLGEIDVKIGVVETKIDSLHDTNKDVKETLKDHGRLDLWVQGTFLTVLLFILGKLFIR